MLKRNELLREQLYNYIKNLLRTGTLSHGDKIRQKEFSEKLGISRSPFRDCMLQLEMEGIVTILPNKGVIVRDRPLAELVELHDLNSILESAAVEMAFPYIQDKVLLRLETLMNEVEGHLAEGDLSLCLQKNVDFHNIMIEKCPNKEIVKESIKSRELSYLLPTKKLNINKKWEQLFWREHKEIIELLKNGTPSELHNYVKEVHLNIKGKEDYFDALYMLEPGTVKKYYETFYLK